MKQRIQVDLQTAADGNYSTVQDALSELQLALEQNTEKDSVDVCEDLLLQYTSRMRESQCESERVIFAFKHNVISRYLKE